MSPRQGEKGDIPLLLNNIGKKSVNDAVPQQGNDKRYIFLGLQILYQFGPLWGAEFQMVTVNSINNACPTWFRYS